MADPTTLQLNIVANADAAVNALGRLSDALTRLRGAVGRGMNLDPIANGISRIMTALSTGIPDAAITSLERAANALQTMSGISNIRITVNNGQAQTAMNGMQQNANDTANAMNGISAGARQAADNLVNMSSRLDVLRMKSEGLRDRLAGGIQPNNFDFSQIGSHIGRIQDLNEKIRNASVTEQDANRTVAQSAQEIANRYVDATDKVELLRQKIEAMRNLLATGIQSGWDPSRVASYAMQIQNLEEKLRSLQTVNDSVRDSRDSIDQTGDAVREAGEKAEASRTGFQSFINSLKDTRAASVLANSSLVRFIVIWLFP